MNRNVPHVTVTEVTKRRHAKVEGAPLTAEQRADVVALVDSVTHTKRRETPVERAIRIAKEKYPDGGDAA